MTLRTLMVPTTLLWLCALVQAADPGLHRLAVEHAIGVVGQPVEVCVTLDTTGGETVDGWSYGVCHPAEQLTLMSVRNGVSTAQIRSGLPPSFNSINEGPVGGAGFTVGVIVDFFGQHALLPGPAHELNVATYQPLAPALSVTPLSFCQSLGQPSVPVLLVVGGQSMVPVTTSGSVTLEEAPRDYIFHAPRQVEAYHPDDGQAEFDVPLAIEERSTAAGTPAPHQGYTLNLRNDAAVLQPLSVVVAGSPMAVNDGLGPAYVAHHVAADGVRLAVIYALFEPVTHTFTVRSPVAKVRYRAVPQQFLGNQSGLISRLVWTLPHEDPTHANVVVVQGQSRHPELRDGLVEMVAVQSAAFVRGDCNADGTFNFADGIWLIAQTTQAGAAQGPCAAACDVNGDLRVDLADGITVFMHQFLAGPPPSAPYPACGKVPESAPCDSFDPCEAP